MSYVFDSEHKTCASIDQVNRIRGILAQANIKFQLIKVDPPVDFHITKYLKESQTVQTNAEFAYPQVVLNGYTIGSCEALVSLAANGELPRIMKLQQNPTQHLKDLINTSYLQPFSQRQKEREQAEQKQAQRQDLVRRDAQPQAFGPEIVQDQNQAEQLRLKELAAETDRLETTLPLDVKQNVETLVPVFSNLFRKTLMIVCQQLRGRELDYIIDYIVANSERLESEQPKFPSLLANKSPAELESEPIVELHEIPKPVKLEKPKSDPVADQSLALIEQNARLTEENKNLSNQLRHLRSEQELSLKIMQEKLVAQIRAQEALQQQLQQQMQAVGAAKAANEALLTALNQQLTVMQ